MKDKHKNISTRSFLVYMGVVLGALIVLGRVIWLFLVPGPELRELDEKNAYRTSTVTGIRGNIFSRDGELLATSLPQFTLRWDYKPLKDRSPGALDTLATGLADALPGSKMTYLKKLKKAAQSKKRYYRIENEVSYEQLKRLKSQPIFCQGSYTSGLITEERPHRQLIFQEQAQRTIGYTTEDSRHNVGLEAAYDEYLSGQKLSRLEKRISAGMYKPVEVGDNVVAKNGKDIVTTLNMRYQDVAETALKNHLMDQKAAAGCAVLMEVHTGEILAIANLSTKTGALKESYNVAIGNSMEPGSTFKLATVLALLDDEKVTINDTVIITNSTKYYYTQKMIDSHIYKGEHTFSLETAFEESSNAAISWFAQKYYGSDPEQFVAKLEGFSLSSMQGIEIPGEPSPLIKDTKHKQWSGVSLPWMSIGYELMLTPLQVLGFYNAVANDGVYVKPKFVNSIMEGGEEVIHFDTEVLNPRIAGEKAIQQAQYLLREVVTEGTGKLAFRNSPYAVAGKTGTAQIHTDDMGYKARQYNASFVGYFPAENPKYSCIVVVNRPGAGKYYASSVAVPVFKEIADKVYASDLSIHHESTDTILKYRAYHYGNTKDLSKIAASMGYNPVIPQSEWGSITMTEGGNTALKQSVPPAGKVPNLKGLGLKDAVFMAQKSGLEVRVTGKGKVANQNPEAGTPLSGIQKIAITLK